MCRFLVSILKLLAVPIISWFIIIVFCWFIFLLFSDKVPLCGPGCFASLSVDQADLDSRVSPASASCVPGLKAQDTTIQLISQKLVHRDSLRPLLKNGFTLIVLLAEMLKVSPKLISLQLCFIHSAMPKFQDQTFSLQDNVLSRLSLYQMYSLLWILTLCGQVCGYEDILCWTGVLSIALLVIENLETNVFGVFLLIFLLSVACYVFLKQKLDRALYEA